MKTLIVTGGTVELEFALNYIQQVQFDYFIASDSGMHFFAQTDMIPNEILGDYDSADPKDLAYFKKNTEIIFHRFQPEKDATDTELALKLAMERGSDEIHILGGTGTRLDHVLGTLHLMGIALIAHIPCYLVDAHNRTRLINGRTVLSRDSQYGRYVSLIPLTTEVAGVTLSGFKYPLTDYTMGGFNSLGVSNEIVEDEAVVELRDGVMILVESKD